MKRIARYCALFAVLLLVPGFGANAQDQGDGDGRARLCYVSTIETPMPRTAQGVCVPPYYEDNTGQCVAATPGHNVFAYIIREDGSLDFGLSYSFSTGHHCGIIGNARETKDGWRYENNMDSDDPEQRCGLAITMNKDYLFFDADPDASCRAECGTQAYLSGVTVPMSAFESTDVTPAALNPEVFFNTPCR